MQLALPGTWGQSCHDTMVRIASAYRCDRFGLIYNFIISCCPRITSDINAVSHLEYAVLSQELTVHNLYLFRYTITNAHTSPYIPPLEGV